MEREEWARQCATTHEERGEEGEEEAMEGTEREGRERNDWHDTLTTKVL